MAPPCVVFLNMWACLPSPGRPERQPSGPAPPRLTTRTPASARSRSVPRAGLPQGGPRGRRDVLCGLSGVMWWLFFVPQPRPRHMVPDDQLAKHVGGS